MAGGIQLNRAFVAVVAALLVAAPALAKPAMWVVRDGDSEVTLYGTVHALPPGLDWLTPLAARRLDDASSLVLEVTLPDDRFAMAATAARLGIHDGQKPLAERVPKALAPRVGAAAAESGVPLVALNRMETWLAAITLSASALQHAGISPASGVEPALTLRAKAAGKTVIGLETIEQQLGYFDALPERDQVALLGATFDEVDVVDKEVARLVGLWQQGDVETIAREFGKEAKASPTLNRVLLTERNARWVDWIGGVMHHPGKVFVAVGAGHFGGPDGLIALLKAKGLKVERIE